MNDGTVSGGGGDIIGGNGSSNDSGSGGGGDIIGGSSGCGCSGSGRGGSSNGALRATDCARWLLGYLGENFYLCYMAQTK